MEANYYLYRFGPNGAEDDLEGTFTSCAEAVEYLSEYGTVKLGKPADRGHRYDVNEDGQVSRWIILSRPHVLKRRAK